MSTFASIPLLGEISQEGIFIFEPLTDEIPPFALTAAAIDALEDEQPEYATESVKRWIIEHRAEISIFVAKAYIESAKNEQQATGWLIEYLAYDRRWKFDLSEQVLDACDWDALKFWIMDQTPDTLAALAVPEPEPEQPAELHPPQESFIPTITKQEAARRTELLRFPHLNPPAPEWAPDEFPYARLDDGEMED